MPNQNSPRDLFPVRAVIRRTGLTADVLRAWERRYGAVTPVRSPGGQRLYRAGDVERLERLRRLTMHGHTIGRIARLSDQDVKALLAVEESSAERMSTDARRMEPDEAERILGASLDAIEELDQVQLDAILRRAALTFGTAAAPEQIFGPLLRRVGELWHSGALRVSHEHLTTTTVRAVLYWLIGASPVASNAPTVVIATTSEERHELGALIVAAVAAAEGWRTLYLGPDVPPRDIAFAAVKGRARGVALSFTYGERETHMIDAVREVRSLLPVGVSLLVGGGTAEARRGALEKLGARVLGCRELRAVLRQGLLGKGMGSGE